MKPIRADLVEPERVDWLWRERIARKTLTVVGGKPDQGKGLFVAHVAAEVSRTRYRTENGDTRWGRVLYSAIEDSYGLMTRPRLEAAGANLKNIELDRFLLPAQQEELTAYLLEFAPDLLVIDPLAAHLSHGINRQSDNIRQVLNPLTELIEVTGTAVIVVEHVLKRPPASGSPLAAIGGSGSGIVAACRMGYLFGVDPADDDRRILAMVKSNLREKGKAIAFELDTVDLDVGDTPYLLLDKEIEFDPIRLLKDPRRDGQVGRPPDKRAAAAEWLTLYLYKAGKPIKAGVVFEDAKQYGMTAKTLRRAAADMEVIRNPPGGGRNCTWDLPENIRELMDEANEWERAAKGEDPTDLTATGEATDAPLVTDEDFADLETFLGNQPPTDGSDDAS